VTSSTVSSAPTGLHRVTATLRKPVAVFAIWALWLTVEYWAMGSHSFVRVWDEGDGFIPARLGLKYDLALGRFGYWAPSWMGGVDRFSQSNNSPVDGLLFLVLPGWVAYAFVLAAQRFVAAYGAYRLGRDDLGLNATASSYAGLAYSMTAQPGYFHWGFSLMDLMALPGIPFVLWSLSRTMRKRGARALLLTTALGIAYSLLSHYFIGMFALLAIAIWLVIAGGTRMAVVVQHGIVFLVGWVAIQAFFLWPALVQASFSQRANYGPWTYADVGTSLHDILQLSLDLGPSLLLFVIALAGTRLRDRLLVRLAVAIGVMYVAYTAYAAAYPFLLAYARVVAGFSMDRVLDTVPFLATMAAAIAVDRFAEVRWDVIRAHTRWLVVAALLVPIGRVVVAKTDNFAAAIDGVTFADLYSHSALTSLRPSATTRESFRVATVASTIEHPSFAWAYGLESADGYLNLYPSRYRDYWAHVIEPLASRDERLAHYLTEWGNRVYLFEPSGGFGSAPVAAERFFDLELLSLANVRYVIAPLPLVGASLQLRARPTDAQLSWGALSARQKMRAWLGGEPRYEPPLYVYENTAVLPRYRLLGAVRVFNSDDAQLDALSRASVTELAQTGFVLGREGGAASAGTACGTGVGGNVKVIEETADTKELLVETNCRAILFVGDNFNPFWTAAVDDTPVVLFPLDKAFQGLRVEPGTHRVRLRYQPPYARFTAR